MALLQFERAFGRDADLRTSYRPFDLHAAVATCHDGWLHVEDFFGQGDGLFGRGNGAVAVPVVFQLTQFIERNFCHKSSFHLVSGANASSTASTFSVCQPNSLTAAVNESRAASIWSELAEGSALIWRKCSRLTCTRSMAARIKLIRVDVIRRGGVIHRRLPHYFRLSSSRWFQRNGCPGRSVEGRSCDILPFPLHSGEVFGNLLA